MPKITYVNGEPLDLGMLEEEFYAIKSHYENLGKTSCCDRDDEFRGYALDHVMARVLIRQESERRNLALSEEELQDGLQSLFAQHGGREAFFENTGMSAAHEDDVKRDLAKSLIVEKTLRDLIGPPLDPSEAEVRSFYENHLSDYLTEEEASALHLYKKVDRVEDRQQIYDLLRQIRDQARSGADFQALALEHTDKEDKLVDLGWFKPGDFMDEFGVIMFSLEEGEISPVFASYFGFHLAKCTGRKKPTPKPFEEIAETVRQRMIAEDQHQRSNDAVAKLKAVATIESKMENSEHE